MEWITIDSKPGEGITSAMQLPDGCLVRAEFSSYAGGVAVSLVFVPDVKLDGKEIVAVDKQN